MTPPKRRATGAMVPPSSTASQTYAVTSRSAPVPPSTQRRVLAWAVSLGGAAVFIVGWIGAKTMAIAIPGDPHHMLSQGVGLGLIFLGIRISSTKKSPRK